MLVMTTTAYPPSKAVEVAQLFMKVEQTPRPAFLKQLHVFTAGSIESGMKTYGIYEIDAGKEYEGLMEIAKRMVQFASIEGFRYQIEPVLTPAESIPLLGITQPARGSRRKR
jgi:hypothetical protein